LISSISVKPTAAGKYEEVFNTDSYQLNWNKIFALPFKITLSTNLREFQYKILNKILYNNEKLFKFKKVDSGLCAIYAKLTRLEIFFQQKVS